MRSESGMSLIETLVALALLGTIGVGFLSSMGTATKATIVADEQVTAESLARSEIEYIKTSNYQSSYLIDPALDIPSGWSISDPAVEALHDPDDGIQKVVISVQRNGKDKFSATIYKTDRE